VNSPIDLISINICVTFTLIAKSITLFDHKSFTGWLRRIRVFCMQNLLESVQRTERGQTKCPKAQLINQPIHANRQLETVVAAAAAHSTDTKTGHRRQYIWAHTIQVYTYSECVCPASKINLQPVSHFRRALSNAHTERRARVKAIGRTN
jgi:hypothetical protein